MHVEAIQETGSTNAAEAAPAQEASFDPASSAGDLDERVDCEDRAPSAAELDLDPANWGSERSWYTTDGFLKAERRFDPVDLARVQELRAAGRNRKEIAAALGLWLDVVNQHWYEIRRREREAEVVA